MQIPLPNRARRKDVWLPVPQSDAEGAQRRSSLRAVPALEQHHSIPMALSEDNRVNAHRIQVRAQFVKLCLHAFSSDCFLHVFIQMGQEVECHREYRLSPSSGSRDGSPVHRKRWEKVVSSGHRLSQGLKESYADGRRQVEASHPGSIYGNLDHGLLGSTQKRRGQSAGFRPEKEAVPGLKTEIEKRLLGMCRKENASTGRQRSMKTLEITVNPHGDRRPVIQAGPFQMTVGQPKPQGFDEVKRRVGCRTCPGNVSRVLRNLRLVEDHLKR